MTGRRRFGSLRKLPSGRFQVRYVGPDGHRHAAPQTSATKTEAGHFLAAVETDVNRGTWLNPLLGAAGLSTYAHDWIKTRRVAGHPLAARTRQTYLHSLDRWITPKLGDVALDRVTPSTVRAWNVRVIEEGGVTAARQAYALLHAVFRTAVDDGLVARNPCRIKGAGQAVSPERPLLSDAEVGRLISAMPDHLRAAAVLAFFAQLRPGELLGLERGDVDLETATVRVQRQVVEVANVPRFVEPKWASARTLSLPGPAVDALRQHFAISPHKLPTAPIFTTPDGSLLREHHVQAAWAAARRVAGLPHARLYDLRHAGLTAAAQEGATLAEVMRRAGHSTVRAAMIYQHGADDRDAEIAERLSQRSLSKTSTNPS